MSKNKSRKKTCITKMSKNKSRKKPVRWTAHDGNIYDVYDKYVIKIQYEVTDEDHDGYCSDPSNIRTNEYKETYTFPLVRAITDADICSGNTVDIYVLEKYYEKSRVSNGNDYCGCGQLYILNQGKIKRRKPPIVLDDSDESDD